MALTEQEELELLELEAQEASAKTIAPVNNFDAKNKQDVLGNRYGQGELSPIGNIFERPGAAFRSSKEALLSGQNPIEGYIKGANLPETAPSPKQSVLDPVADTLLGQFPGLAMGKALSMLENPAATLMSLVGSGAGSTKAAGNIANKAIEMAKPNPAKLIAKAEKLTTEILSPSKKELANYIEKGETLPAVREISKVIKKAKDYTALKNQAEEALETTMSERNKILEQNNYPIKKNYMDKLRTAIIEKQRGGQATPSEINQMKEVLAREEAHYTANKSKFDRLYAQSRKEYLQDQTEGLLTKLENGAVLDTQPARTSALNYIRSGLKDAVEGGDSKVAELNSTYGGLLMAKRLLAERDAVIQKTINESAAQKLAELIRNPRSIFSIMGKDQALNQLKDIPSKTKKIEGLMKKATKK